MRRNMEINKRKRPDKIRILTYTYIGICAMRTYIDNRQRREKKKTDHRSYCSSVQAYIYNFVLGTLDVFLSLWANDNKFTYILSKCIFKTITNGSVSVYGFGTYGLMNGQRDKRQ